MKLDDVKPLNLDEYLGKVKNKVVLVGVELEGAWAELPPGVGELVHDGSVFNGRLPPGANHLGELLIGPVVPAAVGELIKLNHPPKINHTCGMHVHVSFESLWHYHLLMVPEYPATMLHYLGLWAKREGLKDSHCIWGRLRGESRFCRNEFYPDLQARKKQKDHDQNAPGNRYTSIHYCGRYNTIECRVLPMMPSSTKAVSAVMEVIHITNACVYALGLKVDKGKTRGMASVSLPSNMRYEETIVDVL